MGVLRVERPNVVQRARLGYDPFEHGEMLGFQGRAVLIGTGEKRFAQAGMCPAEAMIAPAAEDLLRISDLKDGSRSTTTLDDPNYLAPRRIGPGVAGPNIRYPKDRRQKAWGDRMSSVSGSRVRRALSMCLVLLGVLAMTPALAQAAVSAQTTFEFPSDLAVGQTGRDAVLTLTNGNSQDCLLYTSPSPRDS